MYLIIFFAHPKVRLALPLYVNRIPDRERIKSARQRSNKFAYAVKAVAEKLEAPAEEAAAPAAEAEAPAEA